MTKATPIVIWLVIAGLNLLVQGCREDEQNRSLTYDKGSYQGQPDQALSDDRAAPS
jgi:hypothetical protein